MNNSSILRRRAALTVAAGTAALVLAACGSTSNHNSGMNHSGMASMPGMSTSTSATSGGMAGMPGMENPAGGSGLQASADGMTLTPATVTVAAGRDSSWSFRILGPDGGPITRFQQDQTKLMHLYLIRTDLTGFQHLHPSMAADGTWSVPLPALAPGSYRVYTQFTTDGADGKPVTPVLSTVLTVPGQQSSEPIPAAAPTTQIDGYTVSVGGRLAPGQDGDLSVTVSKDGQPVTDLQPYLDSYAHLTAIHAPDLAFAHLHPQGSVDGDHGGPTLHFHAMLPAAGDWRVFIQFQTGGQLHTAAITVHV